MRSISRGMLRLGEAKDGRPIGLNLNDIHPAPGFHRLQEVSESMPHLKEGVFLGNQQTNVAAGKGAAMKDVGDVNCLPDSLVNREGPKPEEPNKEHHPGRRARIAEFDDNPDKNEIDEYRIEYRAAQVPPHVALRENRAFVVSAKECSLFFADLILCPEVKLDMPEWCFPLSALEE